MCDAYFGFGFSVENLTPDQIQYAKDLWQQITDEDVKLESLPDEFQKIVGEDEPFPSNFVFFEDNEIEVAVNEELHSIRPLHTFFQHLIKKFNLPPVGYTWGTVDSKGWGSGGCVLISEDEIKVVSADTLLKESKWKCLVREIKETLSGKPPNSTLDEWMQNQGD